MDKIEVVLYNYDDNNQSQLVKITNEYLRTKYGRDAQIAFIYQDGTLIKIAPLPKWASENPDKTMQALKELKEEHEVS